MRRVGDRYTKKLQCDDAKESRETRKPVCMTEHDIQNQIRIELSKLGYTVFRINVGKFKMKDGRWFDVGLPKGFSDLIAIKDGRIYFLEVKDSKGKPTSDQINFINRMHEQGCRAGVARSVDDAIKIIQEEDEL